MNLEDALKASQSDAMRGFAEQFQVNMALASIMRKGTLKFETASTPQAACEIVNKLKDQKRMPLGGPVFADGHWVLFYWE